MEPGVGFFGVRGWLCRRLRMALQESEDDFVGAVLELCCLVFTFNSECHLNAKDMAGFYDHARHKYTDVFGIVSLFPYNFMTFIYTITRSLLRRPRGCKKKGPKLFSLLLFKYRFITYFLRCIANPVRWLYAALLVCVFFIFILFSQYI